MTTDSTPRAAKPQTTSAAAATPGEQAESTATSQPVKLRGGRRLVALAAAGIRDPISVGTFAPSSQALANRLASVVPTVAHHDSPVVVELGAGTGEITPAIMRRAGSSARVIAIEHDPKLAAILDRRGLGAEVVAADAMLLPRLLAERGIERVDAVVSAIPFTLMPMDGQRAMLDAVHASVHPNGVFTTVAYAAGLQLPGAVRFRRELGLRFDEVLPTRTIWRNFLPAMTYVCRHPRRAGA